MNGSTEIERIRDALVRMADDAEVDGVDYSVLSTSLDDSGATVLFGDKYGLLRVAAHLVALAAQSPGGHVHLDEHSELEQCEVPLIISRVAERRPLP